LRRLKVMNISFLKAIAEEELYRLENGTELYDGVMTTPEYMKKRETLLKVISEVDEVYKLIEDLDKIKAITERALKSSDPINLYKSLCIKEIADILEIKITESEAEDPVKDKDQITIDDILKEV
jgi:hypothetical protein